MSNSISCSGAIAGIFLLGLTLAGVTQAEPHFRLNTAMQWETADISGHLPDLRFSLIDDHGQPVTAKNYRGKIVLMYFGFAGCMEQCPLTMMRLSHITDGLGTDADKLRILFVTVDPENDTPDVLHNYISLYNDPRIVGLTGSETVLEDTARLYRAAWRHAYNGHGDIPHSNAIYVFDSDGHARLLVAPNDTDDAVRRDLQLLIHQSEGT